MSFPEPPLGPRNQHLVALSQKERVLWWPLPDGLNPHGMEATAGGITFPIPESPRVGAGMLCSLALCPLSTP